MVVGGGDSALTDALYLANNDVRVTIVHRRDTFRAQEHLVKQLQTARYRGTVQYRGQGDPRPRQG